MISIKVTDSSKKELYAEINNKIYGIRELNTIYVKNDIMSAAFSTAAIKFIKETNLMARSVKKSFHHIYEWNEIGTENGRLFRIIKKQGGRGSASIYYKFNNSKKMSPIATNLKIPGRNGRFVSKSGIFKRKAEIMESGKSVKFITTNYIVFNSKKNGITFIPPGKPINIKNPGGKQTTGAFENHFKLWWITNFPSILDNNGVIKKIEINVSKALNKRNAGKEAVRKEVKRTLAPYSLVGSVI